MSAEPITSVFNDGYIAEVYEAYRRDPASVEESWRQFFRFAESLGTIAAAGITPAAPDTTPRAADSDLLRKVAGAAELVEPGSSLGFGQIWESNSFMLAAAVRDAGAEGRRSTRTCRGAAARG